MIRALLALLLVASAEGATTTVLLPMGNYGAGTQSFTNQVVPTGVNGAQLIIDISQASDPLPLMSGSLEGSRDGGTTWAPAGSFSRDAGVKGTVGPNGVVPTTITGTFALDAFWNDTANASRRLRGSATLGGPARIAISVRTLP